MADIVSALPVRVVTRMPTRERFCHCIRAKGSGKIDSNIVDILIKDYDEIMASTCLVCQPVLDNMKISRRISRNS
ncbi:MAG: hypothetical protein ACLVJO_04960 [[Clostridium] scindens]